MHVPTRAQARLLVGISFTQGSLGKKAGLMGLVSRIARVQAFR
jgi:hypothetical protein